MEVPTITTEDDKYVYYEDGKVFSKYSKRFIGSVNVHGYLMMGQNQYIHRVIYEKFHSMKIPEDMVINHIDHNKSNNHIDNLELVTQQQNTQDKVLSSLNTSGIRGVRWDERDCRWTASIRFNEKLERLGNFRCIFDANDAYIKKAEELNNLGYKYRLDSNLAPNLNTPS
jgi:hypothetical protein